MAVEPQVQQFIDFIRDEMPRRIKTNPNSLPDAQKLLVSVSGTLEVIYKTLAELDIAIKSDVDTELSNKEPTIEAGTSSQYWRGDKTWQELNTGAVAESTNLRYLSDAEKARVTSAANASTDGYLTSTDWNTFNSKQAALADVITANTYGSSTQYPVITFNAKGIATGVTLQTVPTPTFTDATFAVQRDGSPSISATWSLTAFTASHVHTYPDKDINFGDMSFIATTDSNTLSGTRTRIVGGSNNNVSGTNVVCINSHYVTAINWGYCTALVSRATPSMSASLRVLTALVAEAFGNAATAYGTTNGSSPATGNCVKAVIGSQSVAVHDVEFLVKVGLTIIGFVLSYAITAMRRITVIKNSGGTIVASSVQTIGTDTVVGTPTGTVTLDITVDTTNNRLRPTVVTSGMGASAEVYANIICTSTFTEST